MAAKDLGPLDWRVPIVDGQGRPSPEFQRRWNTQRGNNGLIGSVTTGSGPPTGTPADGAEFVDTSTTPFTVYIGKGGAWHKAGVVVFTDLGDVPHAYTGHGLALIRVKSTADGLEFVTQSAQLDTLGAPASGQLLQRGATTWALVTISSVLDGISSTRGTVLFRGAGGWAALAPGTAAQVLATGGPGADPSWVTPSGGGSGGASYHGPSGNVQFATTAAGAATKGNFIGLVEAITVSKLYVSLAGAAGLSLQAGIVSVTNVASPVVVANLGNVAASKPTSNIEEVMFTLSSPISLAAGNYIVYVTGLGLATGSTALSLQGITTSGAGNFPNYPTLPVDTTNVANSQNYNLTKNTSPAAGDVFSVNITAPYDIRMKATL